MTEDEEGFREYDLLWKVETTSRSDGPALARYASGLPVPGAMLSCGNLVDPWAYHNRAAQARLLAGDQSGCLFSVGTKFTTKPSRRCQTDSLDDPLLEPPRWRGGFNKISEECQGDKDGNPMLNSAQQRFRGPEVQGVIAYPTVELEMNVAWIDLDFLADHINAVNDAAWWGMDARTIRCDNFTWEQAVHGSCYRYFIVRFSFELNKKTWDLKLLDEGDLVLIPGTVPPQYRRARDDTEELVRVLLDGAGAQLAPGAAPVYKTFRKLAEKDFSSVGWPAVPMGI